MSEHYLKLESVLREYAETGFDRTEEIFFNTGGGDLAADGSAAREVVRTMQSSLARAQSELAAFHQAPENFTHLEEVIKVIRSINGTLDVLGYQEVQPLALGTKLYLLKDLQQSRRKPSPEEFSCVADIVTLLEATLSCIGQNEDHLPLLPVGYDKLRELDTYTSLDLLAEMNLDEAMQEMENKKKARHLAPSTLYQKLRNQRLLTA